ncbi:MAG TPA: branched-chain amino acid ABC transporter permease [Burkholderiales bacterium]|jgi:branched-chain amino acid transport system permease protein
MADRSTQGWLLAAVLAAAVAFPFAAEALGAGYYVGVATRVMIYALAASSLNLVIGYGGMISFGHAAFFGAGAYAVAILAQEGVVSALVAWPLAVAVSVACALVIGAISLRTRGLYFIMITLAFAQMLYYFFLSLKAYGGEDGINLAARSRLPGLDLRDETAFYLLVLAILAGCLYLLKRLAASRFGAVLRGIRENEGRMTALGYPTYRYRLVCFTIAGGAAGLAGALIVNQHGFVSPSLLDWTQSGTLLIMLILGGVGWLYGGVAGAAAMLLLEEILSNWTGYWKLGLGIVLLFVVLRAPGGIGSWLGGGGGRG